MRCKNCGWENAEGSQNCEKCNAPLHGAMTDYANVYDRQHAAQHGHHSHDEQLKATVRDSAVFGTQEAEAPTVCRNCGYEMAPGTASCPMCGHPAQAAAAEPAPTVVQQQPQAFRQQPQAFQQQQQAFQRPQAQTHKCPRCGADLMPGARFCHNCGHTLRQGTVNAWDDPVNVIYCTLRPIAWSKEDKEYEPVTYSGESIVLNRENTDPNNQTITSAEQALLTYDGKDWYIEDKSEAKSTMIRITKKTKLESGDIIALGNRLFEFKD